jgi:hypothetical protein
VSGGVDVLEEILQQPEPNPSYHQRWVGVRVCQACGCSDKDCGVCIALTGGPCSWVTEHLCSACVDQADKVLRAYARIGNRSISPGPIYRAARAYWHGNEPATAAIERAATVLREARPNAAW